MAGQGGPLPERRTVAIEIKNRNRHSQVSPPERGGRMRATNNQRFKNFTELNSGIRESLIITHSLLPFPELKRTENHAGKLVD